MLHAVPPRHGRRRRTVRATACAASAHEAAASPPRFSRRCLFAALAAAAVLPAPRALASGGALAEATFDQLEAFAKSSYEARQLDSALEALSELIRREPEAPVWRERRGQVFVDLKRFDDALADFDAAVAAQPPGFVSLGLLANRALAHEGLANWSAASVDYSRAIMLAQGVGFDAPYLLNGRGNARAALGDYEGALDDFHAASAVFQQIKNLSGAVYADSNAALMEAQLGRDELATKHMEAVARRAPGSIDMRAALAAQRWAAGDQAGAERDWGWACEQINSGILRPGGPALDGCALYRDQAWLRNIRRWPPRIADRLAAFLELRVPPA